MAITIKCKCFITRLYTRSLVQHSYYQRCKQTNFETGTKVAEFAFSIARNDGIQAKEDARQHIAKAEKQKMVIKSLFKMKEMD